MQTSINLAQSLLEVETQRSELLRYQQKKRSESRNHEELKNAVLAYLSEHPNAADTIVGIADWWLMRNQVRVQLPLLQRALYDLTTSNVLEETGTGARKLYRVKSQRESKRGPRGRRSDR